MSEQALKFGDIVVHRIDFHASKQAIALNSVKTGKILVSYKFKHGDEGFKYFIGYLLAMMMMMQLGLCVLFYLK